MSKYMKFAIIVVAVVVVLGAVAGITYAVWSDTGSIPAGGTTVEVTNTTSKYLIFEVYDSAGNFCYVKYNDTSKKYEYAKQYQDEYQDGVAEAELGTKLGTIIYARVVGYANTNLGELESLIIPNSIKVVLNSTTYDSVAVTEIRMMSPEEFPALDLITEVTIPDSVENILDGSFMGLDNLTTVNFEGTKPANISKESFTMCPKLTTVIRP